jgi:hypothetical protein
MTIVKRAYISHRKGSGAEELAKSASALRNYLSMKDRATEMPL